jgi:hypothetical protein
LRTRGGDLVERFKAFNDEFAAFVENCSDEKWQKVCSGERWSVGVVARHVAAGHYRALKLAKMIVDGNELPNITPDEIDQSNARHAEKHADCTRDEVLRILREKGSWVTEYLGGLSDSDLERTAHLGLAHGDVTVHRFIENSILHQGKEHLANMKAATGM